jgi:hypothetical protein
MKKQKTKSIATKLSFAMAGVVFVTCFLLVQHAHGYSLT